MIRFNLPPLKRIVLFLCVTIICLLFSGVVVALITSGELTSAKMRIATLIQDIFGFIMVALVTAMIITRQPADFLALRQRPSWGVMLLITATILMAVPAMNMLIAWDDSLRLPEAWSALETSLRQSENLATERVHLLMGAPTIGSLILSILLVAILAGLSEELFFRGMMQRLFSTAGMNVWVAVVVTALIFSAMHMQFFGFVPRMILGIYFGTLLVWTRSLWTAVWAHVLNNTLATISLWTSARSGDLFDTIPGMGTNNNSLSFVVISIIGVTLLLIATRRASLQK